MRAKQKRRIPVFYKFAVLTYLKLSQKGGKFLTQIRKDAEAQRFFRIKQMSRNFKMFSSRSESTLRRVTASEARRFGKVRFAFGL